MAVYYKFKSAKDFDSIPIDGHFISVINLKEKIFASKHFGRGKDFDLVVTNAQTGEEYIDEGLLIPKNTSVLIRRMPGQPRKPIVTNPEVQVDDETSVLAEPTSSGLFGNDFPDIGLPQDSEWDEFGNDLYSIPEAEPQHVNYPIPDTLPQSKEDEENKIKALIDTPALDWLSQPTDGSTAGRGFGRGGGRMVGGGRNFGRGVMERRTPPPGYVCHRCKVPGHLIQHCPTNGDPNFDIRRVKPPTGIPRSMLIPTPDGSYSLPSGAVAVLRPNEAAFEKEIEGLPSTRPIGDLPPELRCPICKEVMRDAVLTSKCCFKSFCDKCIREHIISKSLCVCGATNVLADDLLPNKTLRDAINRVLESNNSSTENTCSAVQVQDLESALDPPPKALSPNVSVTSTGMRNNIPDVEESACFRETKVENLAASRNDNVSGKFHVLNNNVDASEATFDSTGVRENLSQGGSSMPDEEVQQKTPGELGKKKKKKKTKASLNDMVWQATQENFMMPFMYNPYWNGGLDSGLINAFPTPIPSSYMNYPLPSQFPNHLSTASASAAAAAAVAAQGYILPSPHPSLQNQRVMAEYSGKQPSVMGNREKVLNPRIGTRYTNDKSGMWRSRDGFNGGRGRGCEEASLVMSRPVSSSVRSEEDRHRSRRSHHRERTPPPPPIPRERVGDGHNHHRQPTPPSHIPRERGGDGENHQWRKHPAGDYKGSRSLVESGGEEVGQAAPLQGREEGKQKVSVFSRINYREEEEGEGEGSGGKKRKNSASVEGEEEDKVGVRVNQNGWCKGDEISPLSENSSRSHHHHHHTDRRRRSPTRQR